MNPWLGIALVLGVLTGLIGALALWRRLAEPHVEVTRKLLHFGMGLVALSFPWLFREFWPIVVLAVIGTGGVFVLCTKTFRDGPVDILGGAKRSWPGIVCFSAGIATLHALYLRGNDHRLILYVIPMLLLAVADALAALTGVRYGRHPYGVLGGSKSLEGSGGFLAASFLCSLVPLFLTAEITPVQAVLIAAVLSASTTLLEAVAAKGLDNLLLPVVGYFLLRNFLVWNALALLGSLLLILLTGAILVLLLQLRQPAAITARRPSSARNDTTKRTATKSKSGFP